ncbi:uvrD/REP helicase N-terminal domain protein [Mycobacterium ulcerans str. Harvey]|uniref:UvrD/REP helicase N-terminal domain protein n=1 Tax=Mycobacterium ulcerans str. Harvey TaxID=1299332 RepID=A0ABN0QXN4_MYCUL|nr:uvrD/REP helicase N-terminal domain protein [Mycobacterium ulcerans str. Harvey]
MMLLRAAVGTATPQATAPALGVAELVGSALEAFASDPELLAAERARLRFLLVDDAQQLDPQAARLVEVLAAGAEFALIAGDPNQAVFGFRGGEPAGLLGGPLDGGPAVTLTMSHRCAPAVARAVSGIARRLPGGSAGRHIDGTGTEDGSVTVRLAATAHAEAAAIADALRRAHLVDGVPWSQMAVIVRSVPRVAARLPRALAAAGVPVSIPRSGVTGRGTRGRRAAYGSGCDRRRAQRRSGAGTDHRTHRPRGPRQAAAAAPHPAARRRRSFARGFRGLAGCDVVRGWAPCSRVSGVKPAARATVWAATAGACRAGRGNAMPPCGPRPALHPVGRMASVGSAESLARSHRSRRPGRCPGDPQP